MLYAFKVCVMLSLLQWSEGTSELNTRARSKKLLRKLWINCEKFFWIIKSYSKSFKLCSIKRMFQCFTWFPVEINFRPHIIKKCTFAICLQIDSFTQKYAAIYFKSSSRLIAFVIKTEAFKSQWWLINSPFLLPFTTATKRII